MRFPLRIPIKHPLWPLLLLFLAAQPQAIADTYRLDAGDTIKINVFQEPELSIEAKITAGGMIDYPLIGALKIDGKTLVETEALLDQKLRGDYLIDPQISVSMVSYRPFFITGAVKSPGSYEYQPGLSVRQAVVIVVIIVGDVRITPCLELLQAGQ